MNMYYIIRMIMRIMHIIARRVHTLQSLFYDNADNAYCNDHYNGYITSFV